MKTIKTKMSLTNLNAISEQLKECMGIPNKVFGKKLLEAIESVDLARMNFSTSSDIKDKQKRLEELSPIVKEFEEKKDEVLRKYAAKDEEGNPLTGEPIRTPEGVVHPYLFPEGTLLCKMKQSEIDRIIPDKVMQEHYAMKEEDMVTPIKNENGSFKYAEHVSLESIARFGEMQKLELEFQSVSSEILEIKNIIEHLPFDVEIKTISESDVPPSASANNIIVFNNIGTEALEVYAERVKEAEERAKEATKQS